MKNKHSAFNIFFLILLFPVLLYTWYYACTSEKFNYKTQLFCCTSQTCDYKVNTHDDKELKTQKSFSISDVEEVRALISERKRHGRKLGNVYSLVFIIHNDSSFIFPWSIKTEKDLNDLHKIYNMETLGKNSEPLCVSNENTQEFNESERYAFLFIVLIAYLGIWVTLSNICFKDKNI